jgi:uncharacterized surface anchored protein
MFGIMLAMAVMLVGAPAASAASATPTSRLAQGKVAVSVVDAVKGNTIAGAFVMVSDMAGNTVAKGTTNATGIYTTSLPKGMYVVTVSAENYKTVDQIVTIEGGKVTAVKSDLQPNISATPDPPATSDPPPASLVADGTLIVYALDANMGNTIAGANVVVVDINGRVVAESTTDASGSFTIELYPSEYKVQVSAKGYDTFRTSVGIAPAQKTELKADLRTTPTNW